MCTSPIGNAASKVCVVSCVSVAICCTPPCAARTHNLRRDEDAPAVQTAGLQIADGVVGGVKRIGAGVQDHFALSCQGHQLGQVVIGADEVAYEVDLRRDDVDGGHVDLAAVADDVVGAGTAQ